MTRHPLAPIKHEYELLSYVTRDVLSEVVTARLNDGWVLYGDPFIVDYGGRTYYQAMTRTTL